MNPVANGHGKPASFLERFELEKDPTFQYFGENHRYVLGQDDLLGLTHCLKASMGVNPFFKKSGRDRGNNTHKAMHYLDENDLDWSTVNDSSAAFVRGYEKFKREYNWRPRMREKPMYHRHLRYGFTADGEGWILNNALAILEIKTGGKPDPVYCRAQTAAQKSGIESWDPRKGIKRRRFVVHLPGNNDYNVYECKKDEADLRLWMSSLNIAQEKSVASWISEPRLVEA